MSKVEIVTGEAIVWICTDRGNSAYNLSHITRLYIEETGQGAALKAEIAGKSFMLGYFGSKAEAKGTLQAILEKQEVGGAVYTIS